MLICAQHEHPSARVDAERHLGIALLSFGILPYERQWTQEGPAPKSHEEVGAKEVDHRESRDVTLENMTYKWSHQLSSSNSGKRAQSTIVPVRRVKPCEAVLVKHWACVT